MKAVIVTEKPSVAKEICKVLGINGKQDGYLENDKYIVTWCYGHLVTMSYPEVYDKKFKNWDMDTLPFLPETYLYEVINTKTIKKQFQIIKKLYNRTDIDTIYYAPDPAREGIYIQYLVRQKAGLKKGINEKVIWIDSQTEAEIKKGIKTAKDRKEYDSLAESGYVRAIEDYAIGINLSRALTIKYGRLIYSAAGKNKGAISVGRVMSCVLGMVVQKEREIRDFKEIPFYKIAVGFGDGLEAEFKAVEGSRYYNSPLLYKENGFKEEKDAAECIQKLDRLNFHVAELTQKEQKKNAPYLFNLSELQNECSKKFKINPDETLAIAQKLYELKMTTYPRTDARVLSSAIAVEIEKNLIGLSHSLSVGPYAKEILNNGTYKNIVKSRYTDDSKITDHYAIIPTGELKNEDQLSDMERNVFDLITRRFLSIFFPPAVKSTVSLELISAGEHFFAVNTILVEPGYLKIADVKNTSCNTQLYHTISSYNKGDNVTVHDIVIKEGKTSPPKRYDSGSIILAMENAGNLIEDEELRARIKGNGIGTSATRAEIIKKLVNIEYISLNKKTQVITPTNLGEMIYEVLYMTIPSILSPKMTASWEKGLDKIVDGSITKDVYLKKLNSYIIKETEKIKKENKENDLKKRITPFASSKPKHKLNGKCPLCGGDMTTTAKGGFGCTNYRKDGGCSFYIGKICKKSLTETQVEILLQNKRLGTIKGFKSEKGKTFDAGLALGSDGKISFIFPERKPPKDTDVKCPSCGANMKMNDFSYFCSCGYKISHTIAKKRLSQAQLTDLMNGIEVKVYGMKSKRGKNFGAVLKCDNSGNIEFTEML